MFMFDFRYNCGDANCYQDLARLRGIKYMTWEDLTKLKPEDEVQYILQCYLCVVVKCILCT